MTDETTLAPERIPDSVADIFRAAAPEGMARADLINACRTLMERCEIINNNAKLLQRELGELSGTAHTIKWHESTIMRLRDKLKKTKDKFAAATELTVKLNRRIGYLERKLRSNRIEFTKNKVSAPSHKSARRNAQSAL